MKKSGIEKILFIVVFLIFTIYAISILYLFAFALNSSLIKNGREFINDSVSIAIKPNFKNYWFALQELKVNKVDFLGMLINSIIYSVGTTVLGILSSTFLAYAVAKYDFKFRKFLYNLALFVMIIPIYGALPAQYRFFDQIHFINSWSYLISTAGAFGFNFIVIHSFFESVSSDYMEAAFIDGAGHFTVLFAIMLPMALPSITAIIITSFVGCWNDYQTPLLFLPRLATLSSGLWVYENKIQYSANAPVYFAGALISIVPVLLLFLIFQNTIMEKVYAGGLKG